MQPSLKKGVIPFTRSSTDGTGVARTVAIALLTSACFVKASALVPLINKMLQLHKITY